MYAKALLLIALLHLLTRGLAFVLNSTHECLGLSRTVTRLPPARRFIVTLHMFPDFYQYMEFLTGLKFHFLNQNTCIVARKHFGTTV